MEFWNTTHFSSFQLANTSAFSSSTWDDESLFGWLSSSDDIVISQEGASFLSLESEGTLVFSEGSLGRDFLVGFFATTEDVTTPLGAVLEIKDFLASKLNRGRKILPPFSSPVGDSFFLPSFGDFGRVVGI